MVDADSAEDASHVDGRASTIGADFAVEAPLLRPLPAEEFDTTVMLTAGGPLRAGRGALLLLLIARRVDPAKVRVRLGALDLQVFDGGRQVAHHPRLSEPDSERLVLDHYLEILAGKPSACPGPSPGPSPRPRPARIVSSPRCKRRFRIGEVGAEPGP